MRIRLEHRQFGQSMILGTVLATIGNFLQKAWGKTKSLAEAQSNSPKTLSAENARVVLHVNGIEHTLDLDPRVTLLDALREYLGLTGSKKGCNHGQCGACTVIADGRRINSCLALAVQYEEAEITTIEGLAQGEQLHPMQTAFIAHDGFQCGYCTPGQICSAIAMLDEFAGGAASIVTPTLADPDAPIELSDDEIRERMSGNLCRCGAYPNIVAAVREIQPIRLNDCPKVSNDETI